MVLCHHSLFTRCVVKNWRMAAIFLHAVAQQGVLRDGYVSLLSVQSSIHIAPKNMILSHEYDRKYYRFTCTTVCRPHPAPLLCLLPYEKAFPGVLSRTAKEEDATRRAIAQGIVLFRQHGVNTRRFSDCLGSFGSSGCSSIREVRALPCSQCGWLSSTNCKVEYLSEVGQQ